MLLESFKVHAERVFHNRLRHVTLGKTALYHATFSTTMRLLGFGFHARSIFMRKKCAKCSKGNKTQFFIFSHFFTPFSHFVRAFFTLVCRKETKHVKTVTDFSNVELRHFSYRLATFGQDILLSVTLFSLRLGFLGISSTPVSRLYHHYICIWFCLNIGPQKIDA